MALCYFLISWALCCVTLHIALGDSVQRLDSFNCLWTHSTQFAANEKTVRVNNYDLLGPLASLIGHYYGLDNYLGSASTEWGGALECEDSAQCMQLGQPIRFQEINIVDQPLPESGFILTDSFVTASPEDLLYCRVREKVFLHSNCEQVMSQTADKYNVPMKGRDDLEAGIIYVAAIRRDQLTFIPVSDDGYRGKYLVHADELGRLVIKARKLLVKSMINLLVTMEPFQNRFKKLHTNSECKPALIWSICRHLGLDCTKTLTDNEQTRLDKVCDHLGPKLKSVDKRGLLDFIFLDQMKTLNSLLSTSNINMANIQLIDGNINSLYKYLVKFKYETQTNLNITARRLAAVHGESRVNQYLAELNMNKMIRLAGIHGRLNNIQILLMSHHHRMEAILEQLRPMPRDHAHSCDTNFRGFTVCQDGSAVLVDDNATEAGGVLRVKSVAHVLQTTTVKYADCLDFNTDKAFIGSQRGFILDDNYLRSDNMSVPQQCFAYFSDPNLGCDKYLVSKKNVPRPQLLVAGKTLQFVKNQDYVFLQNSVSGTVSIVDKMNVYHQIGNAVFALSKNDFPIHIDNQQIHWHYLDNRDDAPGLIEFFFELVDPRNFLGLPGLKKRLRKVQGSILSSLSADLFTLYENKPAVKVFFWSSVVTSGLTITVGVIYFIWRVTRNAIDHCKYNRLMQKENAENLSVEELKLSRIYNCTLKKDIRTRVILQRLTQDFIRHVDLTKQHTQIGGTEGLNELINRLETYVDNVDKTNIRSVIDAKLKAGAFSKTNKQQLTGQRSQQLRRPAEGAS